MKKVLLGLLALSATIMASTGEAGSTGENQIDITTKAFIVDSGLIITEKDTENAAAIRSIELDHGTILKTNPAASSVDRDIYIKKSNGGAFPTSSILEISLAGNSNLVNSSSKIPHTLTATIGTGAGVPTGATSSSNVLKIGGTETSVTKTNQFATLQGATAVKVSLNSEIAAGVISNPTLTLLEGAYSNTSTLSVKFSKVPEVDGTPAGRTR
ncbi:hypothetical protein HMPREF0202_01010 [Cetobacterium somerae ATCC BAA-474]|uniref:WxL domain-containing protein n=1 Tax=Cetobacterium somerae ATCC BAA-474 TaxID=1319815 RepID=U7VD21_9FUSO|nr:hypothetical protein [Cetobacterium somerae]ERT69044.1 hypothetical protein HMPREF0202_01010 [Cetobacterium somerae ATCC BAA-474]